MRGWFQRKSVLAGIRISFSIPLLPGLLATVAWAAPPATFESDIKPILDTRCVLCHGATAPQASLDLRSLESLLKGGKSGPAIVPGSAGGSILVEKLVTKSMPPMDPKLSDAEVAAIRGWIDAGALSADDESPSLVTENDVLPIFQVRCLVCHGKREQRGGLDLRTRASRLRGGTSGPALVLGQPEKSLLIQKIESGAMPPVKMQFDYAVRPPGGAELGKLKQWIAAGAPAAPPAKLEALKITAEDKTFWAFQPPNRPKQPEVQHKDIVRNPIDAFLLQKLESQNLTFASEADRLTLLRRAYLDLIGMQPTAAEARAYMADTRPDAYGRFIDRLLESPHYGERWGRHWLDLAGYADSQGFGDSDEPRPFAWRYRDYVIRSLNCDKPYDLFLTEQLAGDELYDYKKAEAVTQEVVDRLAATGFLRTTPDPKHARPHGQGSWARDRPPEASREPCRAGRRPYVRRSHGAWAGLPGKAGILPSPFKFAQHGKSGLWVSDLLPHTAECVDDMAVIRSMYGEHFNHVQALFLMQTGRTIATKPCLGSWVTYGLGTENQNLPAFVVLDDSKGFPVNGIANWQSSFLPALYQGTRVHSEGAPVLNLEPPSEIPTPIMEAERALLSRMDEAHRRAHPREPDLDGRIAAYELAARMQLAASKVFDLSKESAGTQELYGLNDPVTESYGKRCLMARRLVESGVRFVQIYMEKIVWDSHADIVGGHGRCCARTDKPVAGLLKDLKQRGLLDETLVIWGGEFGRMPVAQVANGVPPGRDHGPSGFYIWMAGGGIKGGTVYGATDELGHKAVENRVSVQDFHATVLHSLGLNFRDLTYERHGLRERLTEQFPARVVHEVFS